MDVNTYRILTQASMLAIGTMYLAVYIVNGSVRSEEFIVGSMWLIGSIFYGKINN